MEIFEHRDKLLAAAAGYLSSEKGDQTSAYYDAQMELKEDMLNDAAREYVNAIDGKSDASVGL